MDVFPGPGGCLGLWPDERARGGPGRDSDRVSRGLGPGVSL